MVIAIDTNIFDKLLARPEVVETMRAQVHEGRLTLLVTTVQQHQIGRITDQQKKADLTSILADCHVVGTAGGVLGISILGAFSLLREGRLGRFWPTKTFKDAQDALIGATAERESAILITEDSKFAKRAAKHGVQVWKFDDFRRYLCSTLIDPLARRDLG